MNYLFFALTAATCFAIGQIINKLMSKHSIKGADSLMAYFLLSAFCFNIFLLPFVPLALPSIELVKYLMISVPGFLIGYYCFFSGISKVDASSAAPFFQVQAALVGLLAFVFLGERFPAQNYLWMVVLVVGVVLVSFDEKMNPKSFLKKGILLILLMQVFHATSNLFVGFALKISTPIEVLFWTNIGVGIVYVLFKLIKKPKMNYSVKEVAPMFVSNFVVNIGVIALLRAYAENLTISSVLGLLSAPIVFVVGVVASRVSPTFLEHHSTKVYVVRGIGLLVILLGAYKIALG